MDLSDNISLTQMILEALHDEGFTATGIAPALPHPEDTRHMHAWTAEGRHGAMEYLVRGSEMIGNINTIVSGARSVIMVALPYRNDGNQAKDSGYFIARYARVKDYHKVITRKLKRVVTLIDAEVPGSVSKVFCDTSSVTEKEWAIRAGLGWRGKHSIIINEKSGSFITLGGIVTTVPLKYNEGPVQDRCGSCRRCIDACPTGAICDDRTIDARRCISNMTIENRGEIPEWVGGKIENIMYGCDRCQEACPWNSKPAPELNHELAPDYDITSISREQWMAMTDEEFREHFAAMAVKRAGLEKIRNTIRYIDSHRSPEER